MALTIPKPLTPAQIAAQAGRYGQGAYRAATTDLTPDATITGRGQAQDNYLNRLAAGLAASLRGNREHLEQAANAGPGVIAGLVGANGQANAASVAAGGGGVGVQPGALSWAQVLGQNVPNAMIGQESAALAQGNLDRVRNQDAITQALAGNAQARVGAREKANQAAQDFAASLRQEAFQQSVALDNSQLAHSQYDTNAANTAADNALQAAALNQRASSDQASQASTDAYRQAQLQLAQERIDAQREATAARGGSDPAKARAAIVKQATALVQRLQGQQTTTKTPGSPATPGSPDSTRTTGYRHTVHLTWQVPGPADPVTGQPGPTVPHEENVTLVGTDWNDVARQVQAAYGSHPGFSFSPLGQPEPVTEPVPGTPGHAATPGSSETSSRYTHDQVRGQVFNLLRANGFSPTEARNMALRLVPQGARPTGRTGGGGGHAIL